MYPLRKNDPFEKHGPEGGMEAKKPPEELLFYSNTLHFDSKTTILVGWEHVVSFEFGYLTNHLPFSPFQIHSITLDYTILIWSWIPNILLWQPHTKQE